MKKHIITLLALSALLCSCSSAKTPSGTPAEILIAAAQTEAASETAASETETGKSAVTEAKKEEKIIIDTDFCVLNGVKFGMTPDEVISVLGEPAGTGTNDEKTYLKYGESELVFGDYSKEISSVFKENFPGLKEENKDAEEEDPVHRLTVINIRDHSLDDRLYGGVVIGCTAEQAAEAYFIDEDMKLPDDYQSAQDAGIIRVLYGIDDMVRGIPETPDQKLISFGMISTPGEEDGTDMLMYQAYKGTLVDVLFYELDDEGNVIQISSALSEYR